MSQSESRDCGYKVVISSKAVEDALDKITVESYQKIIVDWIKANHITCLGVSYRLDPLNAVDILGRLVTLLKKERLYASEGAQIRHIHFAGLRPACEMIDKEYNGKIRTFRGGESAEETLLIMGVPESEIPSYITNGCKYDNELLKFGESIIAKGEYADFKPLEKVMYPEFGTLKDRLEYRLDNNFVGGFQPLIRAHSGPFSGELTRQQCLNEYYEWCKDLASAGYLDVLSIGSSQLSQSNFGENWDGKPNGGGVPVNREQEYRNIWEAANPMLVRTYSGTKNVAAMADVYERTINIAWHALSLWWFDELDGRGPNTLYDNLGLTPDVKTDDIAERTEILETSARKILAAMEETIPDLYSPEGLYIAFVAGWLPVPELWSDSDEFIHAKCWETKMQNGGTHLVDHELLVPLETRINKCIAHNADAEYILKSKYKVLTRV